MINQIIDRLVSNGQIPEELRAYAAQELEKAMRRYVSGLVKLYALKGVGTMLASKIAQDTLKQSA